MLDQILESSSEKKSIASSTHASFEPKLAKQITNLSDLAFVLDCTSSTIIFGLSFLLIFGMTFNFIPIIPHYTSVIFYNFVLNFCCRSQRCLYLYFFQNFELRLLMTYSQNPKKYGYTII